MRRKEFPTEQKQQSTRRRTVMAGKDTVTREQFDADLETERQATADYIAADTDYIAAVDAFIGNQAVIDFAAEDATVQALLDNVNTQRAAVDAAKARIPQTPGPKA
jgi:hypothetical protein